MQIWVDVAGRYYRHVPHDCLRIDNPKKREHTQHRLFEFNYNPDPK